MRIKKHRNNNEYLLSKGGYWIRNMCKQNVPSIDINQISQENDYHLFLENEAFNKRLKLPMISNESHVHRNIIIISDGFDFSKKSKILCNISSKEVTVIAVNGALASWELVGALSPHENHRKIDYYIVNNPYKECIKFLPTKHRYYPPCIASTRTNKNFLKQYIGSIRYLYQPVLDEKYSGMFANSLWSIDDYRNPICAAIGIAYRFKVNNLLLLCCDDTLKEQRPASIPTHDGYWRYPQQEISEAIVDANLYWLKKAGANIAYHCVGSKYKNASYIDLERIPEFFGIN